METGAMEIVRLALDTLPAYSFDRPNTLASCDLPEEMLIDRHDTPRPEPQTAESNERENITNIPTLIDPASADNIVNEPNIASSSTTLPYRPKAELSTAFEGFEVDLSSDDEGFSLVREDVMSSPEIIPSTPVVDVLAITGSTYPNDDDDEWTTIGME